MGKFMKKLPHWEKTRRFVYRKMIYMREVSRFVSTYILKSLKKVVTQKLL